MRHVRAQRDERGAAAVEFALVALVFFTLLFGIIQFGLWFWAWEATAHAAREASRVAAVNPCNTGGEVVSAGTDALAGTPGNNASVDPGTPTGPQVGGDVTVIVRFEAVDIGFFSSLGFNGVINKSATSRIENVPAGAGC